jgi:hypothetical protein
MGYFIAGFAVTLGVLTVADVVVECCWLNWYKQGGDCMLTLLAMAVTSTSVELFTAGATLAVTTYTTAKTLKN